MKGVFEVVPSMVESVTRFGELLILYFLFKKLTQPLFNSYLSLTPLSLPPSYLSLPIYVYLLTYVNLPTYPYISMYNCRRPRSRYRSCLNGPLFTIFTYLRIVNSEQQIRVLYKILPMTGFEPRTSGVRSDRSANWATTTPPPLSNSFQVASVSRQPQLATICSATIPPHNWQTYCTD